MIGEIFGEISRLGNILMGRCLDREVYYWKIIIGDVCIREVSIGKCQSGNVRSENCPHNKFDDDSLLK